MTSIDRRLLIGGIAMAGASAAQAQPVITPLSALRKETPLACVYHCDFGDPARVRQMTTNINNHMLAYDFDPFALKIMVVAHAAGIKPFLTSLEGTPWAKDAPDPEAFGRFDALARYGVEVLLCSMTFKINAIPLERAATAPFIRFVPSGVASVGDLQAKGFGYIKIG